MGAANSELRKLLIEEAKSILGDDPELLQKCIPQYPPAGKRMLFDYRALRRENVKLIADPVGSITETGLMTAGGQSYEADVLIYATGFHTTKFLWPMQITGPGGADLMKSWDGDPRAYKGITLPGFPNLFFACMGPTPTWWSTASIIVFSECEMRYILGCMKLLLETGRKAMNYRQDVHDHYNEWIDDGNRQTAWGAPSVTSWYKNEKGRVTGPSACTSSGSKPGRSTRPTTSFYKWLVGERLPPGLSPASGVFGESPLESPLAIARWTDVVQKRCFVPQVQRLLEELTNAYGPTGFEGPVRSILQQELAPWPMT